MENGMLENKKQKAKFFLNLNFSAGLIFVLILLFYFFDFKPVKNEIFLALVSILGTLSVLYGAIKSLLNKKISVDVLTGLALIAAIIKGEWIAAIFINFMITSARIFMDYVGIKSHAAIESLMKLKPKKVKIKKDGQIFEIPIEEVKGGDLVIAELGEMISIDGTIEKGEAEVDQSVISGESMPVLKKEGDSVLSFTMVVSGNLLIRAEKVGKETTSEKIISLMEQSQKKKAPIHTLMDKFSNWYIVGIIFVSAIVYFVFKDVNLLMGILLVSCADDVAVATPLALMSAIVHSAKHGAIVKGGDFLEGMVKVKTVIFDKTGTLTSGKLHIEKVFSFNGWSEERILKLAIAASSGSSHPIAKAIINFAKEKKAAIVESESFKEYGGQGIVAVLENKNLFLGKLSFVEKFSGITIDSQKLNIINDQAEKNFNVAVLAFDKEMVGFLTFADRIKSDAREAISDLKKNGVTKTIMLTGDNEIVAEKVAEETGVDEWKANLLPEDKLVYLKNVLNERDKVVMVGDGVNDAPALALSDIGIAMGAIGSDAAIEAADIAIMKDDLKQIPELMRIGKSAIRVIRQNLFMWAILNALGFVLVFFRVLDSSGAAAYNFITDFIPIVNSLRLFK